MSDEHLPTCYIGQLQYPAYGHRFIAWRREIEALVINQCFVENMHNIVELDWEQIKNKSYDGAIVVRRKGSWIWRDLGNRCYAVIWHALRRLAYQNRRARVCPLAGKLLGAMEVAERKWPSINPGSGVAMSFKGVERCGDLVEAHLGIGFWCDFII